LAYDNKYAGEIIMSNLILNTDSYKVSQFKQYPPGTTHIFSYGESRGIDEYASFNQPLPQENWYDSGNTTSLVFFGIQALIKKYLLTPITRLDIIEAEALLEVHGEPFNKEGWEYILNEHDGYLPVRIEALPEGTVVPQLVPLWRVVNTDPKCAWVTSYIETLLVRLWYPITVATNSYYIKQDIKDSLIRTGGDIAGLPFKLHDFGARGVSSYESSGIGGASHLVNFMGTDTLSGIIHARDFYNAGVVGFSIPASEHSTITSWGRDNEVDAFENMIDTFGGEGKVFACVSDSYNIYEAVTNLWGKELKEKVKNNGGTLVVRPDSGNPTTVVLDVVKLLMDAFAEDVTVVNGTQGKFKLLPSYLRVIQGDGVNRKSIRSILRALELNGLSTDNVAFGMGGALLQDISRDSLKFAMKASGAIINDEFVEVFKDPITDKGKISKKGIQDTVLVDNTIQARTVTLEELDAGVEESIMQVVFENGKLFNETDFEEIRARAV
jgi:nicotinamide phosphoribosyltransferase